LANKLSIGHLVIQTALSVDFPLLTVVNDISTKKADFPKTRWEQNGIITPKNAEKRSLNPSKALVTNIIISLTGRFEQETKQPNSHFG
jgi:hypothetical protein